MNMKFCFGLTSAAAVLMIGSASAALVLVTNTQDSVAGSLRQAIQDAKPRDTVVFQIPTDGSDPGYDASTGVFRIVLTTANLEIDKDLVIDGGGQKIVVQRSFVDASPHFRIFHITQGNVVISGLTIAYGNASDSDGLSGGGINNAGTLTLRNCTVANSDGSTYGGGLVNGTGSATIENCTFDGNTSVNGGGITNFGSLTINGSTFNGNTDTNGGGGAIHDLGTKLTVTSSTIVGNDTAGEGGGIRAGASAAHVRNTVIAGNTSTGASSVDVFGTFISDGYNFIGDLNNQASGFGNPGSHDQTGTDAKPADPKLSDLRDNSGPTFTMAPLPGSPLIDKGDSGGATTDQRGLRRPVDQPAIGNLGDGSDIGAVEAGLPQTGTTLTVTNTSEHDDGNCSTDDCTLVEAMNVANGDPNPSTINFAPGVSGAIYNTQVSAGLAITDPLTITGPGARVLTISGSSVSRVFNITGTEQIVNISGLTIALGNSSGANGGGISNTATLNLTDCAVLNNYGSSGAGAVNSGTLHVNNCTFAGNQSTGNGGALRNVGAMTVTNSTFYNNTSVNSGAIASFASSGPLSLTVTNSTISGNKATDPNGTGGGIFNGVNSTATVTNTIIARNSVSNGNNGPEAYGTFTSGGHNVIRVGVGSNFIDGQNGDQVGGVSVSKDPSLDTLKNNGGPTDTMALLSGSRAINKGDDAKAPKTDQRGYFRPDTSDVGAFESNGIVPVVPSVTTGAATNVTTTTATLHAAVDPNGLSTSFRFTSNFRSFTPQNAGNGTASVPFTVNVTGLTPGTQYHFNTTATNAAGTVQGVQHTFTTVHSATPTPTPKPSPKPTPKPTSTPTATPKPSATPTTLGNISTRVRVETGNNVLIGGFIITGTQPKKVLIRAIGPSLSIAGHLDDPKLELYSGKTLLETNDNWGDSPEKQAIIATTTPPSNNLESAIVRTLPANNSAYTAVVRGVNNGTGVGLVEVYDLDRAANSKLANISTRGLVQTGQNVMIGGFIVLNGNQEVIVRAIGPSLGIVGALADPTLELHDHNGTLLQSNNDWRSNQQAEIIATTVPPKDNRESAVVRTLAPGNYTAIVRGVNNTTGVALVEVFALN
jgi:cell division septation protein DedD